MSLGPVSNFNSALNDIQFLASVLGLDNWDMQPGSYNGVVFHMAITSPLGNLNQYNPLAGPVSAATNYYQNDNANITGTSSSSGNASSQTNNSNLPYGTITVASSMTDNLKRKLVRHPTPNLAGDILEDLGWEGEVIRGTGIIFGADYYTAYYNIFNYFINDNLPLPRDKNVLIHPIKGRIEGVFLNEINITHSSETWRALRFDFTFQCTLPNVPQAPNNTLEQLLSQYLSEVQGIYGGLNSLITNANIFASVL